MKAVLSIALAASLFSVAATSAVAQKLGVGGTGVDEASTLSTCAKPLGTIALVEEKAKSDPRLDAMPPQFRAMMEMAQAEQGGGGSVDPLPLLKLLAARSHCFVIVDRGAGFDALQRERALAAGATSPAQTNTTLQAAEYMLVAQVVYSDTKSRQSGGAAGGLIGGLSDLVIGALGGTYASSDMGKITTLALLDGFRKLTADAQIAIPPK